MDTLLKSMSTAATLSQSKLLRNKSSAASPSWLRIHSDTNLQPNARFHASSMMLPKHKWCNSSMWSGDCP